MKKKLHIFFFVFFTAFILNVSAIGFQQRYDRREDDEDFDPFVIEMTDLHVFKFLKNTWFFDEPLLKKEILIQTYFFNEKMGFGNRIIFESKPFLSCQLKFLMIEYIGFFLPENLQDNFCYFSDFI
ncbi:MAG: hypothetical protein K9G76_03220 [Bacteroidales bacterium]|nr:hypothetical protein [Bacteroidales bacterium]MCF8402803.1 hypothetical protein [Bacteroidales bacterium]